MGARRPERKDLYLAADIQEAIERLRKGRGEHGKDLSCSQYVAFLVRRDDAEQRERERTTLAALAKQEPEQTRRRMLAALDACEGNATRARAIFGAAQRDWERAVEALSLGKEIADQWPARRATQRREHE